MKRKGVKQIPDFSAHRAEAPDRAAAAELQAKADTHRVQPRPAPAPKPQATSSKFGRRGQ